MKHQCDYCGKELKRFMFCNHSHQVMFHNRKIDTVKEELIKMSSLTPKVNLTEKRIDNIVKPYIRKTVEENFEACKHGAMMGLCRFGCK